MKKIKIMLIASLIIFLHGCSTKNLSDTEIADKISNCNYSLIATITVPSRGLVGDAISISSIKTIGLDGGFSETFSNYVKNGFKNIGVYCPNPQKTEAILYNTLSSYKDNELNNVSICVIDMENSEELLSEANRTGSNMKFVH